MLYEMNFDGRGLTPIVVKGLEIGDPVRYAHTGGLFWVIDQDMHGYTIANEKGEQHHGQRLGTPSPYTRITKDSENAQIDSNEIQGLKQAVEYKRDNERIAADRAKQLHTARYDSAVRVIKRDWPNRVADNAQLSHHARAAKNIRLELKTAFPSITFSVRSKSFSMGDDVNVTWTLGPSDGEVSAIVNQYQQGYFDGMQDLYKYDNNPESEAFHAVMGSTKYAFAQRNIPDDLRQQIIDDIRKSYDTPPDEWELSRLAYQAIKGVSFVGKSYAGVDCAAGRWIVLVKEAK